MIVYLLPLNEVVFDFYDRLKSITKGFASFDYAIEEYKKGDLVRVSILVNMFFALFVVLNSWATNILYLTPYI